MKFSREFFDAADALKNQIPFQRFLAELAEVQTQIRAENDLAEGHKLHWGQGKSQILGEILDNCYRATEVVDKVAVTKKEGSGPSVATIT